jgi:hypothetical protein
MTTTLRWPHAVGPSMRLAFAAKALEVWGVSVAWLDEYRCELSGVADAVSGLATMWRAAQMGSALTGEA